MIITLTALIAVYYFVLETAIVCTRTPIVAVSGFAMVSGNNGFGSILFQMWLVTSVLVVAVHSFH